MPPGGNLFKREWLRYYDKHPDFEPGDRIMQSWDTASKTATHNDYSVCTTWHLHAGHFYLLDLCRARYEFPELKKVAIERARAFSVHGVLVEDAGVGTGLISELKHVGISAIAVQATRGKEDRASIETIKFEAGLVMFPTYASWLSELHSELLAFPGGRHDDQVDSIVQMLAYKPPPTPTFRVITF